MCLDCCIVKSGTFIIMSQPLPLLNLKQGRSDPEAAANNKFMELPDDALRHILLAIAQGGAENACRTVQSFCQATRCTEEIFEFVLGALGWSAATNGRTNRQTFLDICNDMVKTLDEIATLPFEQTSFRFLDGRDPTSHTFLPLWDALLDHFEMKRVQPPQPVTDENIHLLAHRCSRTYALGAGSKPHYLEIVATHGPIELWDVSNVWHMKNLFNGYETFNCNLKLWDVSNVRFMNSMFHSCENFNAPIGSWNTSKVREMNNMFYNCEQFDQDLSAWDVSRVESTENMFSGCERFNQPLPWNTPRLTSTGGMFANCYNFDQDLSTFDTSMVTDMSEMFANCFKFNRDLSTFNVGRVRHMEQMFLHCVSFNGNISNWDVRSLESVVEMFMGASVFSGDLNAWDVTGVTSFFNVFEDADAMTSDLVANWSTTHVDHYVQPPPPW